MKVLHPAPLELELLQRIRDALEPGIAFHAAPDADTRALAPEIDGIVGGRIDPDLLANTERLRFQLVPYAGIPVQDRDQLRERPDVQLYNSHFNAGSTAEHAWALLLAVARSLVAASNSLAHGDWSRRYRGPYSLDLAGKNLLVVGHGHVGRRVAEFGRAFSMRVSAIRRHPGHAEGLTRLGGPEDLASMLPDADAVILCLPDTPDTDGIMDEQAFLAMKPGALIINVGRGGSIREEAFIAALESGRLGGAGIDTWWRYPAGLREAESTPPLSVDPARFPNLVLSPHRASHSAGREEARMDDIARILNDIGAGRPPRAVDRRLWY